MDNNNDKKKTKKTDQDIENNDKSNQGMLTEEQTREIAYLARLDLSDEEIKKFSKQLNNILQYFKKLDEVNTDNVEPQTHPTDIKNVFREDKVRPSLSTEDVLKNAPLKEKNYIKGPRIV
ncbi:MAG: Asp-tRNA(Asn)/Glu-tRNA(Gln) amidotransferase subunit GatC [Promethearchaeota archaeon]